MRDLVVMGIFTGMRQQELSALEWSEVDFHEKMLHVPANRMKGKRPFDLPLSDVCLNLLIARRSRGREGRFVFPGNRRGQHTGAFAYALRLIASTGITVSPHDLRRSFASVAATAEIPAIALKLLLAHAFGSDVTEGYVVLPEADLRRAAQKVADLLKEHCGIETPMGVARLG
jgi:integrase